MSGSEAGQVSAHAAEIYEAFYVPGLFGEWAPRIIDAAGIESGQRVADIACGTGVLTRAVAEKVGPEGLVIGVDINQGMLNVARKKAPEIAWRQAAAESLPLDDGSFDAVLCQFGLMYFEDRQSALKEMMRVLRPGGSLALSVWDKLENCPAYAMAEELFRRVLGDEYSDEAPYSLGDQERLQQLLEDSGISGARIQTYEGTARFSSIDDWIYTDVNGWTIDDVVVDDQYERLLKEARQDLARFVTPEGSVAFATPAHIVTANKPRAAE